MRVNFKKKNFGRVFLVLLLSLGISIPGFFYPPKQASALEWYEQLISDADFINTNSMTLQQIQDFLVSKGSYLANYRATWGVNRSAAEWIYEEAQEHGINPQVIIVTLQKEQGLITSSSPSQTALDCAMGYGASPSCTWMFENRPEYRGFGAQIHYAAAGLRSWFDALTSGNCLNYVVYGCRKVGDSIKIPWNHPDKPGYAWVYLSNKATVALYRYTPYIYWGNYNFYTLIRNWFLVWDYTIKKQPDSETVYLIDGTTKRPIYNQYVFEQFGFNWARIETDASISSLPTGSVVYNIIKGDQSDSVYLVNLGRKHPIVNAEVFESWGFKWDGVTTLSQTTVDAIPTGTLLTRLAKGHERDTVYMMDNGLKYPIKNIDTFLNYGWRFDYVSTISQRMADGIPSGPLLTRLAKGSSPTIYLMENNQRRPILNATVFRNRGYSWAEITPFSDSFILDYPLGALIK